MRRPPAGSDETRLDPPDRAEPTARGPSPFAQLYPPQTPIAADGPTVRLDEAFADARPAADDPAPGDEVAADRATTAAPAAAASDPVLVPAAHGDETGPADPMATPLVGSLAAADPTATRGATEAGSTTGPPGEAFQVLPGEARPDPAHSVGAVRPRPAATRLSAGTVLIAVLLALFGFVLVVQLRSTNADEGLSAARQEDLVRILSDLQAREQRLNDDISALESTRQQLASGVEGRQAARAEAERREKELGLLAGTLPARGPGLHITVTGAQGKPVKAAAMLNAVQELRGAGSEVIQLSGSGGTAVRVIASTAFVDDNGGLSVGGTRLTGPYQLTAIGSPKILVPALNIAGGAVAGFERDGGTVNIVELDAVEVTATREPADLKYARPVS